MFLRDSQLFYKTSSDEGFSFLFLRPKEHMQHNKSNFLCLSCSFYNETKSLKMEFLFILLFLKKRSDLCTIKPAEEIRRILD